MTQETSKISIITINYNNQSGLRKTIESVVGQTFTEFEYIIIDGGSTDGSTDVIMEYSNKIDHWVSEKDKGIYNAMNKGIVRASGQYLLFLNSGDFLISTDILFKVSSFLDGSIDLLYGNSVMRSKSTEYIRRPAPNLRFSDFVMRKGPHHQSSLIKRQLFTEIGLYNENYKILADWEFFMKIIFKHGKPIKYLPFNISCYDLTGMSSDDKNKGLLNSEKKQIIQENFPQFAEDYDDLLFYKKLINNSRVIKAYLKYVKGIKY